MCCQHDLYFPWDRFKHICDSQFLEIIDTSRETMPFHDHGVVVCRYSHSPNELSEIFYLSYLLVKGGL